MISPRYVCISKLVNNLTAEAFPYIYVKRAVLALRLEWLALCVFSLPTVLPYTWHVPLSGSNE